MSCKYCNDDFNLVETFEPNNDKYSYIKNWFEIHKNVLEVYLNGKDGKFMINYCPMCGSSVNYHKDK